MGGGSTRGQGHWVLTFSPVSVTTSKGPYMKRPFSTWGRPSHTTVSFARWLEVTFWQDEMARAHSLITRSFREGGASDQLFPGAGQRYD